MFHSMQVEAFDIFTQFEEIAPIENVIRTSDNTFRIYFANQSPENEPFQDPVDLQDFLDALAVLDDNRLAIFCERMLDCDLYELSLMNKRYHDIAVNVLRTRYAELDLNPHKLRQSLEQAGISRPMTLSRFMHFLHTFKPTGIIDPQPYFNRNVVLRALLNSRQHFDGLDVTGEDIEYRIMDELRPHFPTIKRLHMDATGLLDDFGEVDWQLEELHISHSEDPIMPRIVTPKLILLEFGKFTDPAEESLLFDLIAANGGQLKILDFIEDSFTWNGLRSLGELVPSVESLQLSYCTVDDFDGVENQTASGFDSLKECVVHACPESRIILKILSGSPIEQLYLSEYEYDRSLTASIRQMSNLSRLHLYQPGPNVKRLFNDFDMMEVTHSLPKLQYLYVREGEFSLFYIRNILTCENKFVYLDIGLAQRKRLHLDVAECDRISALVDAQPDLHINIEVARNCLEVSEFSLFLTEERKLPEDLLGQA